MQNGAHLRLLTDLFASFDPDRPNFRPTEIFNESWLVRLVVREASKIEDRDYPLGFLPQSQWFSEALLPTVFKARFREDPLAESRTNADCVIGHFLIGKEGKADIELISNCSQFTVVEAKISSRLSSGVTRAGYYDQAARTIACMVETMASAKVLPSNLARLDFIVVAPQSSIEKGTFETELERSSIRSKVARRVSEYEGSLDLWYEKHFDPTLDQIQLHSLSWENVIGWIGNERAQKADQLQEFYKKCLNFN